jgi:hypothetical protein
MAGSTKRAHLDSSLASLDVFRLLGATCVFSISPFVRQDEDLR